MEIHNLDGLGALSSVFAALDARSSPDAPRAWPVQTATAQGPSGRLNRVAISIDAQ